MGSVDESGRRHLVVTRTGRAWVKVRDRSAGRVLTGRLGASWGRDLLERPAEEFLARSRLWVNEPDVRHQFHQRFSVRERYLRLYRDAICTPRQLVLVGDAIAPVSFHHSLARRPRNRDVVAVGRFAAVPRRTLEDAPTPDGTYYHLTSEFPGHFGHFMTKISPGCGNGDQAQEPYPDPRLLISVARPGLPLPAFVTDVLSAYGIDRSDVVCIERPTRVERLVGAAAEFHNWCPADVPWRGPGFDDASFHSDFRF